MTVYTCNISTSSTNANAEVITSIASERINDTGANLVSLEDFPDKGVQVIDGNPPTITRHDLVHAADRGAVADMEYACLGAVRRLGVAWRSARLRWREARTKTLQERGASVRPLPEHSLQGGGYILRPCWTGCVTLASPVPSHARHLISVTTSSRLGFFI